MNRTAPPAGDAFSAGAVARSRRARAPAADPWHHRHIMRNRMLAVGLVGLVLATAVGSAYALPRGFRIRLEGYLGPPPDGRREEADLTLRVGKQDLRFQVTKATMLSGGLAAEVFDRVEPYKPNFTLRGAKELLARVAGTPPGKRHVIVGQGRYGTRDLLVGSVEGDAPPPR